MIVGDSNAVPMNRADLRSVMAVNNLDASLHFFDSLPVSSSESIVPPLDTHLSNSVVSLGSQTNQVGLLPRAMNIINAKYSGLLAAISRTPEGSSGLTTLPTVVPPTTPPQTNASGPPQILPPPQSTSAPPPQSPRFANIKNRPSIPAVPSVSHLFSPFTPNIQHPSTFRPNAPPIISNPQKTTPENPSNTKTHRRNSSLYTPFENQNPVVVIPQSLQIPRRAVFYSSLSNRSSSDESFSSLISTEEML